MTIQKEPRIQTGRNKFRGRCMMIGFVVLNIAIIVWSAAVELSNAKQETYPVRWQFLAAALSPSVWVNGKKLRKLLRTADIGEDTVIYMDYGSREMRHHDGMAAEFAATVQALMERGIWINARIVPNGDHCEACWEEQIPFFMETLFYDRE